MIRFVAERTIQLVPTLFGLTVVLFVAVRLLPGDAAYTLAGEYANAEALARIRESLGLDRPVVIQFGDYLLGLLQLDLGTSLISGLPVWDEVARRYPATAILALLSLTIATIVGLAAGALAAMRPNGRIDFATMAAALAGTAMPVFWLGLLLVLLFAVNLKVLPAGGAAGPASYLLPSFTLGVAAAGIVARMTRSSLLEVLSSEYITSARAKGLTEWQILTRHAFRNALLPVVTTVGLLAGSLLGGSVVVESVFAWPGIGRLLIDAVSARDYPVILGVLLCYGVTFAVLNLVVDVLYSLIDPRIRLSGPT